MGIHVIKDNKVEEYQQTSVNKEIEIEEFLEKHPKVLDKDIFIIGRQVPTATKTRIDLMGLDKDGNVVIIEIKKGISVREVVSQILEYGVWAEDIQYEDLNRIAKERHLSDFQDLYKKFETDFKEIPDPFNQNQRLYIVAEKIDEKIEDVCRYLKVRGIDIKCVELNFYERDGQRLVDTKTIVGTEETIYPELSENTKTERSDWKEKLELATTENRKNVTDLISKIEQKFSCISIPKGAWYNIRTKDKEKRFAVIMCGIKSAKIAFRIEQETFSFDDPEIRYIKGWFFPRETERRISIEPKNFELIMKCVEHSYDTTLNMTR